MDDVHHIPKDSIDHLFHLKMTIPWAWLRYPHLGSAYQAPPFKPCEASLLSNATARRHDEAVFAGRPRGCWTHQWGLNLIMTGPNPWRIVMLNMVMRCLNHHINHIKSCYTVVCSIMIGNSNGITWNNHQDLSIISMIYTCGNHSFEWDSREHGCRWRKHNMSLYLHGWPR